MTTIFGTPETASTLTFDQAIEALDDELSGWVIRPGDEDYEDSRQIRSTIYKRLPAMIVQVANATDVAVAIRFARENDLKVSVRSGGHSFGGHSVNDGGMVIDMRHLNKVSVDPETRTALAQPGATSAMLGAAAQPHGLALSTGDTSSVGLGGLTLGGGIGWMVRQQGLTIDNLLSAEIVTADGDILRASADQNPDLFWALRGGGGNFGIVTEFEYRLHPVGNVVAGMIAYTPSREVLKRYAEAAQAAPDELTTITFLVTLPPAPFVPPEAVGALGFLVMFCYTGDLSRADEAVDPLRSLGTPAFELVAEMPYPAIYNLTAHATAPANETVGSMFLKELSDDVIDNVLQSVLISSPQSMIQIRTLGGQAARVGKDETAFAHRDSPFLIAIAGSWPDDSDGLYEKAWVNDLFGKLAPLSTGAYVNFLANEPGRIGEAYPQETLRRLAEVKRRYDPDNFFSANENVSPSKH
jgi:FAD/FMN-containing dehydrogenase